MLSSGLLIDFSITFSYSIMIKIILYEYFFLILFFTSIALPPTSNFRFKRILLIYESFSFSFFISIIVFSLFACDACVVVRICVRYLNKLHNSCVRTDTDKRVLCRSVEFFFFAKTHVITK